MAAEEEIWRDIPGWEGKYQASSLGRVKSITHKISTCTGKIIDKVGIVRRPFMSKEGYLSVSLKSGGKRAWRSVHSLIAMSFLGHKPDGHKLVVNHIDGDRSNNQVNNLELVSHRDNLTIKYRKYKRPLYSGYPGVTFDKKDKTWKSRIQLNKKNIHIGTFKTEIDAANAYNNMLSRHLK